MMATTETLRSVLRTSLGQPILKLQSVEQRASHPRCSGKPRGTLTQAHWILKKAAETRAAAANRVSSRLNDLKTPHQRSNRYLSLHPGQRHAGARMDACTKSKMPV